MENPPLKVLQQLVQQFLGEIEWHLASFSNKHVFHLHEVSLYVRISPFLNFFFLTFLILPKTRQYPKLFMNPKQLHTFSQADRTWYTTLLCPFTDFYLTLYMQICFIVSQLSKNWSSEADLSRPFRYSSNR